MQLGGPGAFVVAAETYETFASAIRQKLLLEIAGRAVTPPLPVVRTQATPPPPSGPAR